MSEKQDLNLDYDEYEQLEAEAETLASAPSEVINPPSPGARNTAAKQAAARQAKSAIVQGSTTRQKTDEEELAELEEDTSEADQEINDVGQAENMPKWVPFHQPEKIGIINSETREIMEGFKDDGTATGMAKILNQIDAIIVGGGYQ